MSHDALIGTLDRWTRQLTRSSDVEVALVWPLGGQPPDASGPQSLILGSPARVTLTPRDVFGPAVLARATGVVIAHTHLGDNGPSAEDYAVTRRLVAAGVVLGIPLLAHVLVEPSRTMDLLGDHSRAA